ncbi:hypothetical protein WDW37_06970 [Bdellovibrionota bacterium FG-1]
MLSFQLLIKSVVFVGLLGAIQVARADGGLPSDFGPISIDSSRRELQSRMIDWQDDLKVIQTRRVLACTMAGVEGTLAMGLGNAVLAVELLKNLPQYLGSLPDPMGPAAPLSIPLAVLAEHVRLTADEASELERLRNREVMDDSDRIRLIIDTEACLMGISKRLYQDQIDFHFARTEGVVNVFRADAEYCAAFSIRAERDRTLTQAANRILAFYDELERQLAADE